VVSISLDRTAVLWDIRGNSVSRVSVLRGLPDPQLMSSSTVLVHEFRKGTAAGKRSQWLMAFGGHKGLVASMPPPGGDEKIKAKSFVSPQGNKMKFRMRIDAAAILPVRQLLLMGCDDGSVRVCT
jgi:hypothetical protein